MQILLSVPENLVSAFNELLPASHPPCFVTSDPEGSKIGSGGGTAWLLAKHFKNCQTKDFSGYLHSDQRIIIHAGGQSRRLPAYAPSGKVLAPIPIFRWSRGQNLHQNLMDLQMPLYNQLMKVAPPQNRTLIASGDVLVIPNQSFQQLPEADIICLGIWVDPHLASRHGVFFTPRDNATHLSFMLQKPSHKVIEQLTTTHLFMMDVGIWILSNHAIEVLMRKSGWTGSDFINKTPDFYDLYSAFGTGLGSDPTQPDPEISKLTTAIVPLEQGEFYHFGTSSELITSTEAIQNRVKDQRAIWHHKVKPHPSVFVLNANCGIQFNSNLHHIWIENSHVPATWKLSGHHIISGVPENNWNLALSSGICLDIVPIDEETFCIRPYGINDSFSGRAEDAEWMHQKLPHWLSVRELDFAAAGIDSTLDIQNTPLFPVVSAENLSQSLISWMLYGDNKTMKKLWLSAPRLSANGISNRANLKRLFRQRSDFALKNLPLLASNYKRSIFYQADLKQIAADYAFNRLSLPAEPDENTSPLVIASDQMFRSEVLNLLGEDGRVYEKKAYGTLHEFIQKAIHIRSLPRLNVFPDQIVWGRSPARIDLAGGWSDTPPYCFYNGGAVVNMAVNLNGQPPLQVFIRLSDEYKITLRSIDNGVSETIETYEEIGRYDNVGSAFSIPRAALCMAGFHPDFQGQSFNSLKEQLKKFGGGIEISLLVAIPKGSGLGTSSILAATIMGALSDFCALGWDNQAICLNTLILEQMLTTGGGWQDQYGGIFPGIKLFQSQPGLPSNVNVSWLSDRLFKTPENKDKWLLYYTGITRVAKNILSEITRGMFLNEGERLHILDEIKAHASHLFEAIQECDYEATARMIAHSWRLNKQLDSGTNTPEVQSIIDRIGDYALACKLLGAGGGGYLLICAKDSRAAGNIKQILQKNPPNDKARFVDMTISDTGLQISRS